MTRPALPRLRAAGLALAVVASLAAGTVLAGPASASIEDYAAYDGQSTCAGHTLPGTAYLLSYLVRRYPGTSAVSTLRPCGPGGASEHKDGRALDLGADVHDAAQRARVHELFADLFATDRAGHRHALARRMGVMYVIWNDHIYSAYRGFQPRDYLNAACSSLSRCSATLRHRDHVHISLSRAGAAAQTSFFRARKVANEPVLYPGTLRLDPVSTAVTTLEVPADGTTVSAGFKVVRGTTYRLVADGRYRFGPGSRVGDAACRWSRPASAWVPNPNGLLVNGRSVFADGACSGQNTQQTSFTARRTRFLQMQIADPHPHGNRGAVRVSVLRAGLPASLVATHPATSGDGPRPARRAGQRAHRLQHETVQVPARRRHGARATHSLRSGDRYRVVVRGLASSARTAFDGNCVRYAGRFRPQHTLDLARPEADHLTLYVQGVRVALRVPRSQAACDADNHRYVGSFRAVQPGRPGLRIWDPYDYSDNAGSLSVQLVHLRR